MTMTRRELLAGMLAGGVMTAAGLWVPGTKLISIPTGKVFGNEYGINSTFMLLDDLTVKYVGAEDKVVSIKEFIQWMQKNAAHMMKNRADSSDLIVSMRGGYRMNNPEHLNMGTLSQAADPDHLTSEGLREMWISTTDMAGDDLLTDKFYYEDYTKPRERISELDNGHRGYR
jgi:hypothetical protein